MSLYFQDKTISQMKNTCEGNAMIENTVANNLHISHFIFFQS